MRLSPRQLTSFAIAAALALASCSRGDAGAGDVAAATPPTSGGATADAAAPAGAAGGALTATWEYRATPDRLVDFPGIVDAAGNLYWLECFRPSYEACELVSVGRDGALRWRAPLGGAAHAGGVLLHGDHVVAVVAPRHPACDDETTVQARRASDGALAWSFEVVPALEAMAAAPGDACRGATLWSLAARDGEILAPASLELRDPQAPWRRRSWLLALDAGTGALRSALPAPAPPGLDALEWLPHRVAVDERGDVHAQVAAVAGDGALRYFVARVDATGALRHLVADEPGRTLAPSGGALYQSGEELESQFPRGHLALRGAGGELAALAPVFAQVAAVVDDRVLSIGCREPHGEYCMRDLALLAHGRDLAGPLWERVVATDALSVEDGEGGFEHTAPVATAGGTALVAVKARGPRNGPPPGPARLLEVSLGDGSVRLDAVLPGEVAYAGAAALHAGRFTACASHPDASVVRAFDLPGREPAPVGWITAGGSMARSNRPR